jgi:flagellar export protein FliJ
VAEAFRLRRLLELRKRAQEGAERARAAAVAAESAARSVLEGLLDEEEAILEALRSPVSDGARLHWLDGAREAAAARCAAARARLGGLSKASADRARELSDAMKEVKVLERLRERRIREAALDAAREDAKFLDEVASRRPEEDR